MIQPRAKSVMVFPNGNVAVFDEHGEQIPAYQRTVQETLELLLKRVADLEEAAQDVVWQTMYFMDDGGGWRSFHAYDDEETTPALRKLAELIIPAEPANARDEDDDQA